MKTKPWKSTTVPYSIWTTFIFVLVTFTELKSHFIQYMYVYYFVLTIISMVKVEFEVVPQVNEELLSYNNLKEVSVVDVKQEKDILTAKVDGKYVTFDHKIHVANLRRITLHFSKVLDETQESSLYILVHEWHLAGFVDNFRVYKKVPRIYQEAS